MKRPWQVWLVFTLCVGGAAAAMAWLTRQAVETDALRRAARAEAELEQRVSLTLWRMDTELAPIIAGEVIRAPWMYRAAVLPANAAPANAAPANANGFPQPYGVAQAANQLQQNQATQNQSQIPATPPGQPSPLLIEPPEYVICNFEASPDEAWRSPQVPQPEFTAFALSCGVSPQAIADREARVAELAASVDLLSLLAQLPNTSLPSLDAVGHNSTALSNAETPQQVSELRKGLNFLSGNELPIASADGDVDPFAGQATEQTRVKAAAPPPLGKQSRLEDYTERNLRYQSVAQKGILEQQQQYAGAYNSPTPSTEQPAMIGVSRPVWVGERLLLARRVEQGGKTLVQGAWLDWPKLKTRLLAEAVELGPAADLVPAPADEKADPGRMLAGLPVRLVVNPIPLAEASISPTLHWALWIGWGALLLAAAAAAVLLGGVMALSERRAAFVSSVTHELRTPLTTFRMYAEMLARGMVPDADKRQEYLHTLERESERLTGLVENVLAYARLERGRKPQISERATPASLLERIGPRLAHRAEQAAMQCEIEVAQEAAAASLITDPNVVEQILFNLVDNAAKYARAATDRRIHLTVHRNGDHIEFAVRDHGPGIPPRYRSGRIRPFGKSAQESAETAPGVGLGLALCGRLARQLGGRLKIAGEPIGGSRVTLLLPADFN